MVSNKIMDFAVMADHRIKLNESEKKDKYLDLARELKKLWNMKVTIIPIVIGAFGTVTKGLLKGLEYLEIRERPEYREESWRLEETWCRSNSSEEPSAKTDVKNSQGTITKRLLKGLEDLEVSGQVETIQMTALLRTTRILRRVLETWGDLLSLKLQWETIS